MVELVLIPRCWVVHYANLNQENPKMCLETGFTINLLKITPMPGFVLFFQGGNPDGAITLYQE